MPQRISIAAVTACVSGVAHTYMAAERLQLMAKRHNYQIDIETQGALGTENTLDEEIIRAAQVVILCADIDVEQAERFADCRILRCPVHTVLLHTENTAKLPAAIQRLAALPRGTNVTLS